MNKSIQLFFKKYVPGALLVVLLLSPLQSHAALLADDVAVFRQQVKLLTEAIETSGSITETKKNELRAVVSAISDSIGLLELQVQANPTADSSRRVNVRNVTVTGNAKNFTSQAVVEWGPETVGGVSYGSETNTYNYNFVTGLNEAAKIARLAELSKLTFGQLSAEIGIGDLRLKEKATISFSRFDSANDANRNYNPPQRSTGLEKYFGRFSIVNAIDIVAGTTGFSFSLKTDQAEALTLSLEKNSGSDFTSSLAYQTYDNTRTQRRDTTTSREDVTNAFTPLFVGSGNLFSTSDSTVVEDLVDFALDNEVFYEKNTSTNISSARTAAQACFSDEIKDVLEAIMIQYAETNFQTAATIPVKVTAQIITPPQPAGFTRNPGSRGADECMGDGEDYFLTIGSPVR